MRIIILVIVVVLGIAFYYDHSALKPWMAAADHTGVVVSQAVKATGSAASSAIKNVEDGTSVVNKVPNVVMDSVHGIETKAK
jgi:uncharacterized protein (UPF0333 family)